MLKRLLPLAALLLAPTVSAESRLQVTIPTTEQPPTIDGILSEAAWHDATRVPLTLQTRPAENTPAPVPTEARLIATRDTLYVAFIAEDPDPERIRAHLTDRDKSWGDDMVGIKLDTWNQARLAYQFFVNPMGVQHDSIENELTGRESDAWDGIWQSAGVLTENGYQVEMALPLRLFNFDGNLDEQAWGIELVRFYPRDNNYRLAATPVDRDIACRLCQMGVATGFAEAEPGNQLQITPSFTANRIETRDDGDSPWDKEDNMEPGLDVRWGITPDTLLNLTINPDFSQVEADAGQLDVNTTFALFYPEKRPFYLDNADNFATQLNLINTRNLAEPEFGTKITGQRGNHVYGLLQTRDDQTNFLIPGNLGSSIAELGETSDNFAGRYLYDSGNGWQAGVIGTFRESEHYRNAMSGVDLRWEITDQHRIDAMWLYSDTRYPADLSEQFCDGDDCSMPEDASCEFGQCDYNEQVLRTLKEGPFQGQLVRLNYNYESRHWFAYANLYHADEDFRADLGFIDRVDFAKAVAGGGRVWYPEQGFFHEAELSGDVDRSENMDGDLLEQEAEAKFSLSGKYETYVEWYAVTRERVGQRNDGSNLSVTGNAPMFDETFGGFYGEVRPVKPFKFGVGARHGDEIDFANNQLGTITQLNGWMNWKPTRSITAHLRHHWRELDVDGGTLFTANLSDLRLTWQFNVRSFLRLSTIYTHIDRDPSLYQYNDVDENDQRLSSEVLYGYKLNPQTVFYAGYSDGRYADDTETDLVQDSRTYFMKVSYAWLI
ncbi:carbohydrate binding family 9 domain-containing protein [Ferrimonas balearica]|uniref:carbohydrate binding family 9 domain-containing protein n=1 Tax=Ferrimonas balearica TaxID=44012 RepID=UPI001C95E773|nr:carbohydrate binding family 9 domain-containing protein [Ferrimonas balearica]MBY6226211.1 carbohydrate binding family 9 domain-containing protein [Ferrimonas balearica]